jgi:hypothetical protein
VQCEAWEEELGFEASMKSKLRSSELSIEDEPTIFVARNEDPHGDIETRTFQTRALALDWQADIGRPNWDDERDGPRPDDVGVA